MTLIYIRYIVTLHVLHHPAHRYFFSWGCQYVCMVCHQHVGMNLTTVSVTSFCKQREIDLIIDFFEENNLTVVPSLYDMDR